MCAPCVGKSIPRTSAVMIAPRPANIRGTTARQNSNSSLIHTTLYHVMSDDVNDCILCHKPMLEGQALQTVTRDDGEERTYHFACNEEVRRRFYRGICLACGEADKLPYWPRCQKCKDGNLDYAGYSAT